LCSDYLPIQPNSQVKKVLRKNNFTCVSTGAETQIANRMLRLRILKLVDSTRLEQVLDPVRLIVAGKKWRMAVMITRLAHCLFAAAAYCSFISAGVQASESARNEKGSHQPPNYSFAPLPVDSGRQQSTVTGIVQTRDGYLWLGTYNGLVRFDGEQFTVFKANETNNLPNSRITSIYEDQRGMLWIGHETGDLTTHDRLGFHPVKGKGTLPRVGIESIVADATGDIWFISANGLFIRVRDGLELDAPGGGSPSRKAWVSREPGGRLWVTANGIAATLEGEAMVPVDFGESGLNPFYQRVCPSSKGGIWVVGNGQIRRWRDGQWVEETSACAGANRSVTVLAETRSRDLVIGTLDDGLYLIPEGGQPLHFSRTNGLSHDWVRSFCEDHEGNLWIGTGGGLASLRARKASMLECPGDWEGRAVLSFVISSNGAAWIGTEGAGLYRFESNNWTRFEESRGLANLFVWSVLETRGGELYAGTWGGGLMIKKGERFETPPELANFNAPIRALLESTNGDIWIGTTIGLYKYSSKNLSLVANREKLETPDVRAIEEGPDGTIWFGMSGGGLGMWKNGQLRQFRKKDGLSSDFIEALHVQGDGVLWIGTTDSGLDRLREGRFSSAGCSSSAVISHIVDDGEGSLWLGTDQGITRAPKAQLNRCADGLMKSVASLTFGTAEGLNTLTCSGGFRPGACKTSRGELWFPMTRGLAVINLRNVAPNPNPPPVVIEQMLVDLKPVDLPAPRSREVLQISPGKRRFDISYTALSFAAPERVRFRRYLEGLDKDWSEPVMKRSVEYSYLRPGPYVFHVMACNNDGIWSEIDESLAFFVQPRFWQTWWFQASSATSAALGVAGAALWVSRRRMREKLDRLERQQAIERERARIARDIHDDLGASLTRITMLGQSVRAELDHEPDLAADLDQIYLTARELTRAMDEIVWAVNPKHDSLDSLFAYLGRFAQNFLSTAGIRCRLDEPPQLPVWALTAEVRHNVFLAFKESLHNVVRHATATEVRIALELQIDRFILTVTDNGRGFDWTSVTNQAPPPSDSSRTSSGNGVANMQRRLEEIGGRCDWHTSPGHGTRVTMLVTLKPAG
jgi:signal transduction histidine kinase/ligand-binding sensor domain-containing protein